MMNESGGIGSSSYPCAASSIESLSAAGRIAADIMTFARETLPHIMSPVQFRNAIDGYVREQKACQPRWLSIGLGVNDRYINNVWYEPEPFLEGDVVKVEIGIEIAGKYVEVAETLIFGVGRQEDEALVKGTAYALEAGIAKALPGGRIVDMTNAIERSLLDFGLVPSPFGAGHAIRQDDEEPDKRTHPWIFNAIPTSQARWADGTSFDAREIDDSLNTSLEAGMCLAIEPCALSFFDVPVQDTRQVSDGTGAMQLRLPFWRSESGGRIAKFVHTLLIREDGPLVLTQPSKER
ncbi:M24 family metallopeptidase [Prosthecochloris aestuarii]|nr:M24 family metallopeptidase [Prosthecochloris aestuarii]